MGCTPHWFLVPALAALARNAASTSSAVNAGQLSAWVDDEHIVFAQGTAETALQYLHKLGYVRPASIGNVRRYTVGGSLKGWYVTPAGAEAAKAAWRSLPTGPAPDVTELSTRLWNLLRIRRRLTADEAAETLVDAGASFASGKKRIGALLAAWAKFAPKTVAIAQKREAGRIRYVLLDDLGRWPPPAKAGEIHPTAFTRVQPIPARYRRTGAGA